MLVVSIEAKVQLGTFPSRGHHAGTNTPRWRRTLGLMRTRCLHYRKLALCRLQFYLPTVFFRHSAKRSLCQLEFPAVGKAGFTDCLDLPTARQLAKNCSRQRQAMIDAIHAVTFADCHSVSSRQRRRLCQLPSSLAVGKGSLPTATDDSRQRINFFFDFRSQFFCVALLQ